MTLIQIFTSWQPVWWAVKSGQDKMRRKEIMVEVDMAMRREGQRADSEGAWWEPFEQYPRPELIEKMIASGYKFALVDCPELLTGIFNKHAECRHEFDERWRARCLKKYGKQEIRKGGIVWKYYNLDQQGEA